MGQPVSREEFEQFRSTVNEQHEQTRKLITKQLVAVDQRFRALQEQLEALTSRRPDPAMLRDFWLRRVPKIQEELAALQRQVATMKGGPVNV